MTNNILCDYNTVIAVANGTKYYDDHTDSNTDGKASTWTLEITKEFLVSSSNNYYVCEDFVDEIPKFGEIK